MYEAAYATHTIEFGVAPDGTWHASCALLPAPVSGRTSAEAADAARAAIAAACGSMLTELVSMTVVPATVPIVFRRRPQPPAHTTGTGDA